MTSSEASVVVVVVTVAVQQVVYQDVSKVKTLQDVLLSTEDYVLAEATNNDRNWGMGLDKGDKRAQNPQQWPALKPQKGRRCPISRSPQRDLRATNTLKVVI